MPTAQHEFNQYEPIKGNDFVDKIIGNTNTNTDTNINTNSDIYHHRIGIIKNENEFLVFIR